MHNLLVLGIRFPLTKMNGKELNQQLKVLNMILVHLPSGGGVPTGH